MPDLAAAVLSAVLVLVAAFGAMADSALSRISRVRAHRLEQEKRRGSGLLLKIVEDSAPFMNVVLLVRVAALVSAAVLITTLVVRNLDAAGEAVAILCLLVVVYVFAEMIPRTYAVQQTERVALSLAAPVFVSGKILQPLSKVLVMISNAFMLLLPGRGLPKGPFVSEEEARTLSEIAEQEEEIEEEEREMIHSIFEFGDTVVREVMVPRPDMVAIKSDATVDEALGTIVGAGYSRIPIFEGDTDNITGVLYAKDVLKKLHESGRRIKVTQLRREPLFIPEQKKVSELLREMQQQHVHMAIVVDEYGGTAGLVTIEDLIEEIVGEIVDEYDQEEPLVEPIDDDTLRVDAKMPIDEINELLRVNLPHEEWDTVGGLVYGLTGRVPVAGESVRYDSLEFVTERVSGRRIQKVVIKRMAGEPEPVE